VALASRDKVDTFPSFREFKAPRKRLAVGSGGPLFRAFLREARADEVPNLCRQVCRHVRATCEQSLACIHREFGMNERMSAQRHRCIHSRDILATIPYFFPRQRQRDRYEASLDRHSPMILADSAFDRSSRGSIRHGPVGKSSPRFVYGAMFS